MPHHIYQTKGFVLGSTAFGEADKLVHIFTEDLGLVGAVAKSLRSAKSKLRHSLQSGTYSRVDLVRGREVWRVTDAEELGRISPVENIEKAKVIAGVFSLVRRFVHGEDRDEDLFRTLREIFFFLKEENIGPEDLKNLEILAALRILAVLGYSEKPEYMGKRLSAKFLFEFSVHREDALGKIRKAIETSHL